MKRLALIVFVLLLVIASSSSVFADTSMNLEEAKAYLEGYSVHEVNEYGNGFTVSYEFDSDEDLINAANYIVEHGLDAFNQEVAAAIAAISDSESDNAGATLRYTTPASVSRYVSADGIYVLSGSAYGLASFATLGTVEYNVDLGYTVTVANGTITGLNSVSCNVWALSPGGSWGNLTIQTSNGGTYCSATAYYVITKSVQISIGDGSFTIKSETDNESFTLVTYKQ